MPRALMPRTCIFTQVLCVERQSFIWLIKRDDTDEDLRTGRPRNRSTEYVETPPMLQPTDWQQRRQSAQKNSKETVDGRTSASIVAVLHRRRMFTWLSNKIFGLFRYGEKNRFGYWEQHNLFDLLNRQQNRIDSLKTRITNHDVQRGTDRCHIGRRAQILARILRRDTRKSQCQ